MPAPARRPHGVGGREIGRGGAVGFDIYDGPARILGAYSEIVVGFGPPRVDAGKIGAGVFEAVLARRALRAYVAREDGNTRLGIGARCVVTGRKNNCCPRQEAEL